MNRRMVFYTLGQIVRVSSLLMLLPALVALIYREKTVFSFLIAVAIAVCLGTVLTLIAKPKDRVIYAKEGFAIVSLAWLAMSAIGALPFYISGEIASYTNAFFETVSGFTTTGASILNHGEIEAMSRGLLFWRSFTNWIGGMGVLVFIMAIIPNISDRSIHIMRAEMPGPIIGKLVPRVKDTAKILYLIYIVMTIVLAILLLCGGMPLFDSIVHAFSTAGTGGFSIKSASIGFYSPYCQWVIAIFMILFGINFNLYYLLLLRRFKSILRSEEFWCYLAIILISVVTITVNITARFSDFTETIRAAFFQVSSIITTTGYSTVDLDALPTFSKGVLFSLMFIGGCAGSTAGGLKVARLMILCKKIRKELRHLLHPRSVSAVKFEGRTLDDTTGNTVGVYFILYMLIFFVVFLLLCLEPFDLETSLTAATSCFNNIGPAFSAASASYSIFSPFSKWLLSFAMLFGRLEIFPMFLLFSPTTWSKTK